LGEWDQKERPETTTIKLIRRFFDIGTPGFLISKKNLVYLLNFTQKFSYFFKITFSAVFPME